MQKLRREIAAKQELLQAAIALREAEKLAVVGRLASSIAHEINNPLEAVTNLIYLAVSEENGLTVREYLTQAQGELARVSNIPTQPCAFTGKRQKQPKSFCPRCWKVF